jgi:ribosomal protein S20
MKKTILIIAFLGATNLFAQEQPNTELIETIKNLQTQVNQQQNDIQKLYSELNKEYRTYRIVKKDLNQTIIDNQVKVVDSLNTLIDKSKQELSTINKQLNTKIQQTDENANSKISELDSSLDKNRLYWIIATLATLLLGGLLYWLLGKRMLSDKNEVKNQIQSSKTDVETQIKNTKTALEEESVKLDSQLLEIISSQLKIKESESKTSGNEEKDHSLVLKVADEVTRILMNLEVMDKSIKGYKHLKKYSESILDNLKAYGYEIPQLIGQNYNSGMNMVATLEFDDTIEEGKQIIKRIIKPQVNFDKKMIQAAKVIVAFNE